MSNSPHVSIKSRERVRRKIDAVSRAEMAVALGVRQNTVSDWLRGQNFPHPRRLPQIAAFLSVEPTALYAVLSERVEAFAQGNRIGRGNRWPSRVAEDGGASREAQVAA